MRRLRRGLGARAAYRRRGYRLLRVHLDAMDEVRWRKPEVPEIGAGGIPVRDLWELEKRLAGRPR